MSDSLQPQGLQHPRLPSFTISRSLLKFMSDESVMPCNHLILCHPLLLLPSIFPSIRLFSNEPALHSRWSKYWSFSFSVSPSNEYSGLISFRTGWFDLHVVQGTLKSLLQKKKKKSSPAPQFKSIKFFSTQPCLWYNSHIHNDYWKNHSFDYTDLCQQSNVFAF